MGTNKMRDISREQFESFGREVMGWEDDDFRLGSNGSTYYWSTTGDAWVFWQASRETLVVGAQHARDSAELRRVCQARDDAKREVDQLKAELAGLRTGFEAQNQVNAELRAEVESLRKAITDINGALEREYWSEYAGLEETRAILNAAMGQGEQP
ncbi:hypothetical protein ACW582_16205 [Pseudomonas chlororaphis]